ncbi:MAG: ATP-binding cassette domain-containing protein [Puniceicoccales bacterium]|jgi:polar amino acid transport system ATP-binding protein|nr:ATP-binding cassette domain-containing protein [Puniceicoccales bacterium]
MLRINNVSKMFHGRHVLRNITVSIERGCILGLAGPSGSGKSTLLRCIQGLDIPDAGTVQCAGRVGFMFQDFQLFPHMTAGKNISYAPQLHGTLPKDVLAACMADLLKKLGIADLVDRYPDSLSGGQKQRVALARSLILEPDMLLCDEPTSGLDVATTNDVAELLHSVRPKIATMVIASHDLDFLVQATDRIVLLREGAITTDIVVRETENPVKYLHSHYCTKT